MWSGISWEYFTASDWVERWLEDLWGLGGIGDGLFLLLLMCAHHGIFVVFVLSIGVIVPVSSSVIGLFSLLGLFSYRELRVMLKEKWSWRKWRRKDDSVDHTCSVAHTASSPNLLSHQSCFVCPGYTCTIIVGEKYCFFRFLVFHNIYLLIGI